MKLEDFMCSYTNIRGAMAPARPPVSAPAKAPCDMRASCTPAVGDYLFSSLIWADACMISIDQHACNTTSG